MRKTAFFVIVLLSFITYPLQGQERIKRFIPQLLQVANDSKIHFSQGNVISGCNKRVYCVSIVQNPRESFSKSILDSLQTAFKEEMAYATESDHYEKHMAGHDSITLIVAYGDKARGYSVPDAAPVSLHSYYGFETSAILVIADSTISFHFNSREPMGESDCFYDKALKDKVNFVAKMKGVKKSMVKKIRLGNAKRGSGEESAIQYDVPKEAAQQVFDDFNNLITEYCKIGRQRLDIVQKRNEATIIFGEYFENTLYHISLTPENTARIIVFPRAEEVPEIK